MHLHIRMPYAPYLYAGTYKNVKFITQKTGHLYLGTTYPHREVDNQPTPGSKVWWGHPCTDLVWGIYTV